jgi:hypothetical protein
MIRRIARRNDAQQGYVDKVSGNHSSHRDGPRRSPASLNRPLRLRGLQALMSGPPTPEFEVTLDLPTGGHDTLIGTKIPAKIQNGTLMVGEAHSAHMNTYIERTSSGRLPGEEIAEEGEGGAKPEREKFREIVYLDMCNNYSGTTKLASGIG